MNRLPLATCLSVCLAQTLTAQSQVVYGRVELLGKGSLAARLRGTGIELVSNSVDLQQLNPFLDFALTVEPSLGRDGPLALDVTSATPTPGTLRMGRLRPGVSDDWSVSGLPGGLAIVFLCATERTGFLPLGQAGTWLLGPEPGFLRMGFIDAGGSFRFAYTPPTFAQPGESWTAQAFVIEGGAIRCTNADSQAVELNGRACGTAASLSGDSLADAVVPDDFPTIQAAVDQAQDLNNNGTIEIFVRGGVYGENVEIRRSNLELSGDPQDRPVIRGTGPGETLEVECANNVRLLHLQIESVAALPCDVGNGLEVEHSNTCTLTDIVVQNCNDGIEIEDSDGVTLQDSVVFRNLDEGVEIKKSYDCTVSHNEITENGEEGIEAHRANNLTVEDNQLNDNGEEGMRVRQSTGFAHLRRNQCLRNHENGARIEDVAGLDLVGNDLSDTQGNGLRMRDIAGAVVQQNRLADNTGYGMRLHDVSADFGNGATTPPGNNTISGNGSGDVRIDGH
jgi:parallel beta-helix repeat protein